MSQERMEKTCPMCGSVFYTRLGARIYCVDCAGWDVDKEHPPKICIRCERRFIPDRSTQKYCTTHCQGTDYNEKHDRAQQMRDIRARKKEERRKLVTQRIR
jgi:ribosomal protein S27AE